MSFVSIQEERAAENEEQYPASPEDRSRSIARQLYGSA
jgi:hypothetical protein